uniref:Uncharacterized protein n=1 Tax=Molossus molossus TaxID=27622 RepID=A0A7J8E2T5_MOLMO|nr:hypothetical protein HJG59_009084 [Molossus molossus]
MCSGSESTTGLSAGCVPLWRGALPASPVAVTDEHRLRQPEADSSWGHTSSLFLSFPFGCTRCEAGSLPRWECGPREPGRMCPPPAQKQRSHGGGGSSREELAGPAPGACPRLSPGVGPRSAPRPGAR